MEITFDFITFMHLTALVLGFVSTAVIMYFGIKVNPANQPLAIGQLSISLAIFVSFSLVSKLIVHWPFMYRMGNFFALIFIPMPYLYTVFNTRKRVWKWYDLLHAIPLVLYLVDLWDALSLSIAEKTRLILLEINDLDQYGQFNQSKYFGPGFHEEFRTVLFSVYWAVQVFVLFKWLKSHPSLSPQNRIWKNWMRLFLGCQFFMWFPFYLSLAGMNIMTTYHIVNSFSVVWLMISSLSLFFYPSLLYGRTTENPPLMSKITRFNTKSLPTKEEVKKLEEFMQIIESQMVNKKPFLTAEYSINDLSRESNVPVYQILKSLNKFKGYSFADYINHQRIQFCVSKFEKGEWLNFTLEAVAIECGFSNRNSLTKSFKKFKDCSPSEYRDSLRLQKASNDGE